ncbi:MAG: hypothetical protein ABJG47_17370 [Ekhidna sp.]
MKHHISLFAKASLKPLIVSSFFVLCAGCDSTIREENKALQMKVDSLEAAFETGEYAIGLLEVVGQYLDSIDLRRESVLVDLEVGVEDRDYLQKIKHLNQYFQKTEWAIRELENISGTYSIQVDRLKTTVEQKNDEINRLQISVNQYRNVEDSLKGRLEITESALQKTQKSLDFSRMDVALAEMEVMGLMGLVQLTEAEIYFAEGEGLEELAGKIKLAPKKKRKNLEEALNAFTTSFEMGYLPAKQRMERLKERLESQ